VGISAISVISGMVLVFAASGSAQEKIDLQTTRGAITQVVTLDDPAQSYTLYLPSQYSTDRRWPVIYAFDPFARGKTAVEVYREAAEKYGYIVVGSNNAKNGPTGPELEAAQAMWNDTHRRLSIDKDRTYTTGLSGGARVATTFALYCYTCAITGVIAHGATYPVNLNPKLQTNDHFLYYVAIGDEDFNYPEVVALRKKKDEAGAPYKIKVYPGPHQWAPPEVAADALAWLKLKAMQAGTDKVDKAFVHKLFEAAEAEAAQAEQRKDAMNEFYALHSLAFDFKGLEDVTEFENKLAQFRSSKTWKDALHKEQREIEDQASLTTTAGGELQQFGNDQESQAGLRNNLVKVFSDLRRRSKSSGSDHLVASRAFFQLWIGGIEAGQEDFRKGLFVQAALYFDLMAEANPDQAWPLVLLAEAQARAGNKKSALKALEEAQHRGLKNPQALAQDPELQTLISDPTFQRITQTTPQR
jgi:dienelactone hydrolase